MTSAIDKTLKNMFYMLTLSKWFFYLCSRK